MSLFYKHLLQGQNSNTETITEANYFGLHKNIRHLHLELQLRYICDNTKQVFICLAILVGVYQKILHIISKLLDLIILYQIFD